MKLLPVEKQAHVEIRSEEKEEVVERVRRGRACTRKEKRVPIVQGVHLRMLRECLYVASLNKMYKGEMRMHQKILEEAGRRGIFDVALPEYLHQMKQTMKTAEGNVNVARISRDAVKALPPLQNSLSEVLSSTKMTKQGVRDLNDL